MPSGADTLPRLPAKAASGHASYSDRDLRRPVCQMAETLPDGFQPQKVLPVSQNCDTGMAISLYVLAPFLLHNDLSYR